MYILLTDTELITGACGMDNCVAFVDVVGNLVWMGAGACIMVGFLDDAVVVGIIGGFINLSAVSCLGG